MTFKSYVRAYLPPIGWLFIIQGVVFWALWSEFLRLGVFYSQNSLYHATFADHYIHQRTSLDSLNLLETSFFGVRFIDQHFSYHVVLGILSHLFGMEWAMTGLSLFTLGLAIFALGLLLRDCKVPCPFLFAIGILLIAPPAYERMLWGRPTALFLAIMLFHVRNSLFGPNFWQSFVLALVVATFSYGALIFLPISVFLGLAWPRAKERIFREAIAVSGGLGIGLLLSANPIENLIYLTRLASHLFIFEDEIREWLPNGNFTRQSLIGQVFLLAAFSFRLFLSFSPEAKKISRSLCILALFFFIMFVQVARFDHFFMALSGAALMVTLNVARFKRPVFKRSLLMLTGIFFGFMTIKNYRYIGDDILKRPQIKVGEFRDFTHWLLLSPLKDKKITLFSWSDWSAFLYLNRSLKFEPGYSPFLYQLRHPQFSSWQEKMLSNDPEVALPAVRSLLYFLNSDLLLVRKSNRQYNMFRRIPAFQLRYEDSALALFKVDFDTTPERAEGFKGFETESASSYLQSFRPLKKGIAPWKIREEKLGVAERLEFSWEFLKRFNRGKENPYFSYDPLKSAWISVGLDEQASRLRAYGMHVCQSANAQGLAEKSRFEALGICRVQAQVVAQDLENGGYEAPHFINLAMSALEAEKAGVYKISRVEVKRHLEKTGKAAREALNDYLATIGLDRPPGNPIGIAVAFAGLSRFYRNSPQEFASLNIFLAIQPEVLRLIRNIPHFFIIRWLSETYANAYFVDRNPLYLEVLTALWSLAERYSVERTWYDGTKTHCIGGYVPGVAHEPLPTNTTALMAEGFSYWFFALDKVQERIPSFKDSVLSFMDCYSRYQVTPQIAKAGGLSANRIGSFLFSPSPNWSRIDTQGHAHQALLNIVSEAQ